MKKAGVGIIIVAVAVLVAALGLKQRGNQDTVAKRQTAPSRPVDLSQPTNALARVPAHYETAPSANSLGPTLTPTKFLGKTRQAYEVAGKIPVTLAQLPCYCSCDETVGHKSLYSCFEDEHAASCAVCVDEALLAYKLEKSGKTAEQIREQIIAEYSMTAH